MVNIKVVDSIPGSGKTSSAINLMNKDKDNKYIYITPYLNEIKRIKSNVNRKFYEPEYYQDNKLYSSKFDSLHGLLSQERNIVSTHSLFKRSNRTTRELIKSSDYILILDEVMDVVEKLDIKKNDLEALFKLELLYEKDGFLLWNEERKDWDSRYNDIRDMALNRNLIKYKDTILIWTFPADIFESFKEIYILTYQFEAQIQKYYYDLYNLEYNYYIATKQNNKYTIIPRPIDYSEKEFKTFLKSKINILQDDKLNAIGERETALSKSWYMHSESELLSRLKLNTENYFRHRSNSKAKYNMWTTFKDYQGKMKGKGYTKGFVSLNARATNEYRERENLAYLINRYPNTIIYNFMSIKGITINKDYYAISECLQWIFRSAIRDDKEINIYIPSLRMRNLLIKWLDDEI